MVSMPSRSWGAGRDGVRRWGARVGVATLLMGCVVAPAMTSVERAEAWDSYPPGADSHRAITLAAIDQILRDTREPAAFRSWVQVNKLTLAMYSTTLPRNPFGELVHRVKRPLATPTVDEATACDPTVHLWQRPTGIARWAVGSNGGDSHPEYWWQTAVCLWRSGHKSEAVQVVGQLAHQVADQGALPHAYFKMHGGFGEDQGFEYLSAESPYDASYYTHPNSVFFPGKNVLDIGDHGDRAWATFAIPKQAGWTPIRLSPRAVDSKPAYLQMTSASHVVIDVSVAQVAAAPKIRLAAKYERADGTTKYLEHDLQLSGVTTARWHLYDRFAANGRLWLSFKRIDKAVVASTGRVQVYVAGSSKAVPDVVPKPVLNHPWEYYEWLREWTQWVGQNPYWRRYFAGVGFGGGDLGFTHTWTLAKNSERAILSLQWRMSQQVTVWMLEDAFRLFNTPGYTVAKASGQGYRVALYHNTHFNSHPAVESPEYEVSYAIGCEPYPGQTCGQFVPRSGKRLPNLVGDGIFTASGVGDRVTMKANTLPPMLDRAIRSIEVRGARVILYSGTNLTGDQLPVTKDVIDLGEWRNRARSIRILPADVDAGAAPTAADDTASTAPTAAVNIPVLDNDTGVDPADITLRVTAPAHGTATVDGGTIIYTPVQDFTAPWPGKDTFTYEVTSRSTGLADSATVTVNVGQVSPRAGAPLQPMGSSEDFPYGFGHAAAISADGTSALVSDPMHYSSIAGYGQVYAYSRPATTMSWSAPTRLPAPDASEGHLFGSNVAMSADGTTALVSEGLGSPRSDNRVSVYAYSRTVTGWSAPQQIYSADVQRSGQGFEIGLNGDGTIAVIGDPDVAGEPGQNPATGAVFLYTRSGSTWTRQQRLPVPADALRVGEPVAISRDGRTVAVGGLRSNQPVLAYTRASTSAGFGNPTSLTLRSRDGRITWAAFSLALSADGATLLAAPGDADSDVIVYGRDGTAWTEQGRLPLPDGAYLHAGLGLSPDARIALVGEDIWGINAAGRVSVYVLGSGGWQRTHSLTPPASFGSNTMHFGQAVALADTGSLIVGAPSADHDSGVPAGDAATFELMPRN